MQKGPSSLKHFHIEQKCGLGVTTDKQLHRRRGYVVFFVSPTDQERDTDGAGLTRRCRHNAQGNGPV